MSLYDMYFSKKNKNYIFEIISKIVKDECDIDIINDKKYINIYTLHYSTIFDKNNTEVLSELNSDVINTIGEIIINDIRNNKNDNIINKTEKKINHNSLQNFEKSKKKIILYSTNRNINSLNRYKFNINYEYNNLFPKYITLLKEENNSLFTNPNIYVSFNDNNILFKYKNKQILDDKEFYTYETITDEKIDCFEKLDIEIKNHLMNIPIIYSDIYLINNIKKINYKNNNYLCLDINNHDIKINDELGLFINDIKIIYHLFVKKVMKNFILVNYSDINLENNYSCIQVNKNISITVDVEI